MLTEEITEEFQKKTDQNDPSNNKSNTYDVDVPKLLDVCVRRKQPNDKFFSKIRVDYVPKTSQQRSHHMLRECDFMHGSGIKKQYELKLSVLSSNYVPRQDKSVRAIHSTTRSLTGLKPANIIIPWQEICENGDDDPHGIVTLWALKTMVGYILNKNNYPITEEYKASTFCLSTMIDEISSRYGLTATINERSSWEI